MDIHLDIHRGGRAVCKSTGQNPGLRQGLGGGYPGVRWQVEGASRDGAGGGKAMAHGGRGPGKGGEKKRKTQKKEPKKAYSTTDSLVVPHRSTEVA